MATFALLVLKKNSILVGPIIQVSSHPESRWVFFHETNRDLGHCPPRQHYEHLVLSRHPGRHRGSGGKTTWIHQQLQIGGGGKMLCCRFHYAWWRSKCSFLIKNGSPALPHPENSRMSLESKRDPFFFQRQTSWTPTINHTLFMGYVCLQGG